MKHGKKLNKFMVPSCEILLHNFDWERAREGEGEGGGREGGRYANRRVTRTETAWRNKRLWKGCKWEIVREKILGFFFCGKLWANVVFLGLIPIGQ